MTTTIFRGDAVAVQKVLLVNPKSPDGWVKIGFSSTKCLEFEEWAPAEIILAWQAAANTDGMYREITIQSATVSGTPVVGNNGPSLLFTHSTAGEDFHIYATSENEGITSSIFRVTFTNNPTGGTFTITFMGQTTSGITYSTTTATTIANMIAGLEALSNVNPGDVEVTYDGGVYSIKFVGQYEGVNVTLPTLDDANLTGGNGQVAVTTLQVGNPGTNESFTLTVEGGSGEASVFQNTVQDVSVSSNTISGTVTIEVPGYGVSGPLNYYIGADLFQYALEAIVGIGNVVCSRGPLNSGLPIRVEFIGELSGIAIPEMILNVDDLTVGDSLTGESVTHTNGSVTTKYLYSFAVPALAQATPADYECRFYLTPTSMVSSGTGSGTAVIDTAYIACNGANAAAFKTLLEGSTWDWRSETPANDDFDLRHGYGPNKIFPTDGFICTGTVGGGTITVEFQGPFYPGSLNEDNQRFLGMEFKKISDSSLSVAVSTMTNANFVREKQAVYWEHDFAAGGNLTGTIQLKFGDVVTGPINLSGLTGDAYSQAGELYARCYRAIIDAMAEEIGILCKPASRLTVSIANSPGSSIYTSYDIAYPVTASGLESAFATVSKPDASDWLASGTAFRWGFVWAVKNLNARVNPANMPNVPNSWQEVADFINGSIKDQDVSTRLGLQLVQPGTWDEEETRWGIGFTFLGFPFFGNEADEWEVVTVDGSGPGGDVTVLSAGGNTSVAVSSYVHLRITNPITSVVYNIPVDFDASASEIEDAINAAAGAEVCSVSGGDLNTNPVVVEFINTWAFKNVVVQVFDFVNTGTQYVREQASNSPGFSNNRFIFRIAPGYGTPGIVSVANQVNDPVTVCWIRVTLPGNRKMVTHLQFKDLTPWRLRSVINEMFQKDVCTVYRTRHSLREAIVPIVTSGEYNLIQPDARQGRNPETEVDENENIVDAEMVGGSVDNNFQTSIAAFWYEDEYEIRFHGVYDDPATITSVEIFPPTVSQLNGETTSYHKLDISDITILTYDVGQGPGTPDALILGKNVTDNDDMTLQTVRNAWGMVYSQQAGYKPFMLEVIRPLTPSSSTTSWKAKVLSKYMHSVGDYNQPREEDRAYYDQIGEGYRPSMTYIRFEWTYLHRTADGPRTDLFRLLAHSKWLPINATAEQMRAALLDMKGSVSEYANVNTGQRIDTNGQNPPVYTVFPGGVSVSGSFDTEVQITLSGKYSKIPLDQFGYQLRMNVFAPMAVGPQNAAVANPKAVIGWIDQTSGPTPPFINSKYAIDPTELDDTFYIGIDGTYTVTASKTMTVEQLTDQLNTALSWVGAWMSPYPSSWLLKVLTVNVGGEDQIDTTNPWFPLEYLSSVRVHGTTLSEPFTIEFTGQGFQGADHVVGVGQEADTDTVTVEFDEGAAAQAHIVKFQAAGTRSGNFVLHYDGDDSSSLSAVINLADFDTAVESLYGSAVTTTGTSLQTGYTCNFGNVVVTAWTATGTLNNSHGLLVLGELGGIPVGMELLEIVRGAGPKFWDCKTNWSLSEVPSSEDVIIVDEAESDILYGIDQTSVATLVSLAPLTMRHTNKRRVFLAGQKVYCDWIGTNPTGLTDGYYFICEAFRDGSFTLATTKDGDPIVVSNRGSGSMKLTIKDADFKTYARYGGIIGLPNIRSGVGYEYLPLYLKMPFAKVTLGIDLDGDHIRSGRFDCCDAPTEIAVYDTGSGVDSNIPAVLFLANNEDVEYRQLNGNVGFSVYPGEESMIKSVQKGVEGTLLLSNIEVIENIDIADNITFRRCIIGGITHAGI